MPVLVLARTELVHRLGHMGGKGHREEDLSLCLSSQPGGLTSQGGLGLPERVRGGVLALRGGRETSWPWRPVSWIRDRLQLTRASLLARLLAALGSPGVSRMGTEDFLVTSEADWNVLPWGHLVVSIREDLINMSKSDFVVLAKTVAFVLLQAFVFILSRSDPFALSKADILDLSKADLPVFVLS